MRFYIDKDVTQSLNWHTVLRIVVVYNCNKKSTVFYSKYKINQLSLCARLRSQWNTIMILYVLDTNIDL